MTEKEIIREWKKNEKPFGLVCKEMQDWARETRSYDFELFYNRNDGWGEQYQRKLGDSYTYRLRPDYPEAAGVVECEVKPCSNGWLNYKLYVGDRRLKRAIEDPHFIGYKSDEWLYGRLYRHKTGGGVSNIIRYANLDQYEVLPIDAVVFEEGSNANRKN